ncbi:hypothetical protein GCM10023314_28410 [Algibacter agarivorans]|uniref:HTH araC/xylS-type domain-containing protein n=1 Tax=Algibacter agarivorans TaxID=1109741 RepID=A0ABP9GX77_9FLAO
MLNTNQSLHLNLINIEQIVFNKTWGFDNIINPFSKFYFIKKGAGYIIIDRKKINLLSGHIYLVPSYAHSSFKCHSGHSHIQMSYIETFGNSFSIYNFMAFKHQIKATPLDINCFDRLLKINTKEKFFSRTPQGYLHNSELYSSKMMETQAILKIILSKFIKLDHKNTGTSGKTRLNKVINYISQNLHKKISITELAAYTNLNRDYFSRMFNNQFKMRPSLYIQIKRIERAELLLITTNYSLIEISIKVGYENYTSFLQVFKKHVGQPPSHFRKNQVDNIK